MNEVSIDRSRNQVVRKTLLNQIGWAGFFLAPNFILVMLFTFIPAVGGLALSTAEWDVFSAPKFAGAENYVDLVDYDDFLDRAPQHHRLYLHYRAGRNCAFACAGNCAQPEAAGHTHLSHDILHTCDHVWACLSATLGNGFSMPTTVRSTTFCGKSGSKDRAGSTTLAGRSLRW